MLSSRWFPLAFFCLAFVAACSGGTTTDTDSGGTADTGGGSLDGGSGRDSGSTTADSGADAATTTPDSGSDAATTATDSGSDAATTTADSGSDAATTRDTGTCPTPISDLTAIGMNCAGAGDCPSGYTCRAFSGIVLTHSCEIDCSPTGCPCPATTTCNPHSDKAGTWNQCDLPAG